MGAEVDPDRKPAGGLRFRLFQETAEAWPTLGIYQRFEQVVALALSVLISGLIVAVTARLIVVEAKNFFLNPIAIADDTVIHSIFGMIMTVLIALEFNHTIVNILHRKESIVQLKIVIVIALLAMARKFIVVDFAGVQPLEIVGLACAVLALGLVYWLVREQDRRDAA